MWRRHRRRVGTPSGTMNVESQIALDEAVARALQYVEDKLAASSLSETTVTQDGLHETSSSPANGARTSMDTSDLATEQVDIDPDNMTYEELRSLGEAIGTENKGLPNEVISSLPSSTYKTVLFPSEDEHKLCVICLMSYENQETLITLPCQHHYHSQCVTEWLKISKVCPICNKEVFGF